MDRRLWLLVALGVGLRLTGLAVHSLWYDECATLHVALADEPLQVLLGDRHPPLSHWLVGAWAHWFGTSDATLRVLPALCSCVTLAMFAWLVGGGGQQQRGGGLALAMLACSPMSIWYAQELRMYTFVECGAVAAWLGVRRWAQHRASAALLITAGSCLAFGSHYLGATVAVQVAVLSVAQARPWRSRVLLLLPAAAGIAIWVPWLLHALGSQFATSWGFQARTQLLDLATLPVRLVLIQLAHLPMWLVLAIAAFLLLGAVRSAWLVRANQAVREAWLAFLAPILSTALLGLVLPPTFVPNYLIASAPPLLLLVASGLTHLPAWLSRFTPALVPLLLLATMELRAENRKEDYKSACRELAASWQPGDVVTTISGTPEDFSQAPLRHYLRGHPATPTILPYGIAINRLDDPQFTGRVQVIWRASEYAEPQLARLLRDARIVHQGPLRYRIQHLVLTGH